MQQSIGTQRIVLVGAGHTNLHIVRMWGKRPIPSAKLTLVSAYPQATYSGMLPGTLAELYTPDQMMIDLKPLCDACGVELIASRATGLNAANRHVELENHSPLSFDVVSVGIGSIPAAQNVWANQPEILSIKPMQTFLKRLDDHLRTIAEETAPNPNANSSLDVSIVGGGAAGVEVAMCLHARLKNHGVAARFHILESGDRLLKTHTEQTRRLAERELTRRSINIRVQSRAERFEAGQLITADGEAIPADMVVWAAGAASPAVLNRFALPKTEDGFLAVRSTLQTTADLPAFIVGDTATFVDADVPKAGVYAVREGSVLWTNLNRLLSGDELVEFRPQKSFLSLISTGDGRAIGEYKGVAAYSRWLWWLKDSIDRRFVQKYRVSR